MKEEWKNIAGSTWIKVVLAAIIVNWHVKEESVIPMLYSGIFWVLCGILTEMRIKYLLQ